METIVFISFCLLALVSQKIYYRKARKKKLAAFVKKIDDMEKE
jgi:hypothetical protein